MMTITLPGCMVHPIVEIPEAHPYTGAREIRDQFNEAFGHDSVGCY